MMMRVFDMQIVSYQHDAVVRDIIMDDLPSSADPAISIKSYDTPFPMLTRIAM